MRKLVAGFAMSLDGFIEGPNGEYDWIIYDQEQFKELARYWERMDTMLYGRKTYEVCLATQSASKQNNPFAHMKHYVFSKTLKSGAEGFTIINGDLEKEVIKIKSEPGKDIAVFGGAELVSSLINLNLIDELVLAICPVVLGKGKPFFINIKERKNYRLKEVKSYASGLVSLTYGKPV
jgi:dihydrofolate reductase